MNLNHCLDYPLYVWRLLRGDRTRAEVAAAAGRNKDVLEHVAEISSARILDLANGRLRPQYLILKAQGYDVAGIDILNKPTCSLGDYSYKLARFVFACWLKKPLVLFGRQQLVCGDVSALPFADNTFDLVTSIAAFEHFLDVPKVLSELSRIVKPNGVIWIAIHLFTSLSGGHNVSCRLGPITSMNQGVQPWDHLRSRKLPFSVPLNQMRLGEYLAEFSKHFEIVKHYAAGTEGEGFLTPEILRELSEYSKEELLTASYIIVAKKPRN
jgi:SAM-dependent methyltransferase